MPAIADATNISQALLKQVSVTWGYDKQHELANMRFTKPVEMLVAGNAGGALFRGYFNKARLNGTTVGESAGCALRLLLRPSRQAAEARERIRPAFWPRHRAAGTTPRVGLHLRASGVLLNRKMHNGFGMYMHSDVTDATLGCGNAGLSQGLPLSQAVAREQYGVEHFGEFWQAAAEAERVAASLLGTHAPARNATGYATHNHSAAGDLLGPALRSRWLLATDSPDLKDSAHRLWPIRSGTTAITPSHVRCGGGAFLLERRLETVAEALLLAEADTIVHGTSRFASTALLLCERCVASFSVELDQR